MFSTEAGQHTFNKRCLQVFIYCGTAAVISLVLASVLVLTLTLSNSKCDVDCRSSSLAAGVVLLGFALLVVLLVVYSAVELCKRKISLLKRSVIVDGKERVGVEVRDRELEELVSTTDDVRHFQRGGRSRIVQEARRQQQQLEKVIEALTPVGVVSHVNKYIEPEPASGTVMDQIIREHLARKEAHIPTGTSAGVLFANGLSLKGEDSDDSDGRQSTTASVGNSIGRAPYIVQLELE